jgi:hypothetical protein
MEIDENNVPEKQGDDYVEIYSKAAILGFSIFPTPLFGGVLLMMNLNAAGYKKAIYSVLIFLLVYFFAVNIITSEILLAFKIDVTKINLAVPSKALIPVYGLSLLFNIIGGLILTQYFFKKYFPDNDYFPKSIASPVLVIVAIMVLGRLLMS